MARAGLLRATLTLLAGGALAQALPLLLGPWLTRLYTPQEFGLYHVFAAVAANIAVVAGARYEFALPIARDEAEATTLRALCAGMLVVVTVLSALAALAWAWVAQAAWPLWLPVSVALLGAVSLATLQATRRQHTRALAGARVLQYGGGSGAQVAAALALGPAAHAGAAGLIAAPLVAAAAALAWLGWPFGGLRGQGREQLRAVALQHKDFPLLNTPHAFMGALSDTVTIALIAGSLGAAAAGAWGLTLRYLKAPATLVGGAVSQALYPRLAATGPGATAAGRAVVLRVMAALAAIAAPLVLLLWLAAPGLFAWAFGEAWRAAGELAAALAVYIGVHFVASPLAVVTMAWNAQAWALKLATVGQLAFVGALAVGLHFGGLQGAGWAVSAATAVYFGFYFWSLATWPVDEVAA